MSAGLLICVSGIESSGKSTQLERLERAAADAGERPIVVWSRPGYTPTLEAVKRTAKRLRGRAEGGPPSGTPRVYPRRAAGFRSRLALRAWLGAALLDLIWLYAVRVRLWRAAGRTVICDRYWLDCAVDFRVNFPEQHVESSRLGRILRATAPRPDVALLLELPVADSMRRSEGRERRFRENEEVLEQRFAAYADLARETGTRVIDAQQPPERVAEVIHALIREARRSPSAET